MKWRTNGLFYFLSSLNIVLFLTISKKWADHGLFFVYFSPFSVTISIIQIEKNKDGVLGIRTRGCCMVGTDETMELWQPPITPYYLCNWIRATVLLVEHMWNEMNGIGNYINKHLNQDTIKTLNKTVFLIINTQ